MFFSNQRQKGSGFGEQEKLGRMAGGEMIIRTYCKKKKAFQLKINKKYKPPTNHMKKSS